MKVHAWLTLALLALLVRDTPHRGVGSRGLAQGPEEERPVRSAPRELAGFEIELGVNELERIIPLFDWNRIDAESGEFIQRHGLIPRAAIRNYLNHRPENFDTLPPEVRAELSQGLTHPRREPAWGRVLDRWGRMVREGRAPIRLENLPPSALASAILSDGIAIMGRRNTLFPLHLRADLPPEVRSILAPLSWHVDGSTLEFILDQPTSRVEEAIELARGFARLAGQEDHLFPRTYSQENRVTSLHIHYSREGSALYEPVHLLNLLLFAEGSTVHGESVLTDKFGLHAIPDRGLVRIYPPGNHFELRYGAGRDLTQWLELFRRELDNPGLLAGRLTRALQSPTAQAMIAKALKESATQTYAILDALQVLDHHIPGWVGQQTEIMDTIRTSVRDSPSRDLNRFILTLHQPPADLEERALQAFREHSRIGSTDIAAWAGVRHPEVRRVTHAALESLRPAQVEAFAEVLPLVPDQEDLAIVRNYVRQCMGGGTETARTGRIIADFVRRARTPEDLALVINRLPEWPARIRTPVTETLLSEALLLTPHLRAQLEFLAKNDPAIAQGFPACPSLNRVTQAL